MKYINHMSSSQEDDKHAEAMRLAGGGIHGWAIYGLYWAIAEKIAAQIRSEQITTWMTKSWKKWASDFELRPTFFQKQVRTLAEVGLIRLYSDEKVACIQIPNILKYADEYIRGILKKSGDTPESYRDKPPNTSLQAFKNNKDLKTGACGIVDNCAYDHGANDGGNGLDAIPPSAPRPRKSKATDLAVGNMTPEQLIAAAKALKGISH